MSGIELPIHRVGQAQHGALVIKQLVNSIHAPLELIKKLETLVFRHFFNSFLQKVIVRLLAFGQALGVEAHIFPPYGRPEKPDTPCDVAAVKIISNLL